ncbi:peptidoglycan hydrolase CwlO-like protein [Mycolicibacterium lutetiense]|uniref:Peptidoglycan hydrolase CwlO-like protein n=2 Tax=Mycolicibacterium lutetiense TaxID=1641992 RepID=A0ABS4ZWJ8_9MYCO|nr:peptidoglycan hydrolase CwlO-like protein [Mycolicibacterium lutetiense]
MRQSLARLTAQLAELEGLTCAKEAEVEELKLQPDPDQGRIDQLEAEIASNYVEIDGLTLQISSLSQVIDEHC